MAINKFQEHLCEYLKDLHRGEREAIHSCELEELFEITGSQLRYAVNQLRSNGYPICSSDFGYYYAANQDITAEDVGDAETVKAPYYKRLPLVFECKMRSYNDFCYEADVIKVSASEMILDTGGDLDLSTMMSEMTLIED